MTKYSCYYPLILTKRDWWRTQRKHVNQKLCLVLPWFVGLSISFSFITIVSVYVFAYKQPCFALRARQSDSKKTKAVNVTSNYD